jgi:phospholipid-binding lipoprotein MlaA
MISLSRRELATPNMQLREIAQSCPVLCPESDYLGQHQMTNNIESQATKLLPHISKTHLPVIFAGAHLLAACSVPDTPTDIHDPYEAVNRVTHDVNTAIDTVALRPASQVYGNVVPQPVRSKLDNATRNLGLPAAMINKLLQGQVEEAGENGFRFLINSTLGLFGLFDPAAQDFGLNENEARFGDTLAVWGAPEGAYVVLPVLGPSTERDTAGLIVDIATNPIGTLFGSDTEDAQLGLTVTETLNYRYTFAETFDSILYDSEDSYAQLRLFYLDNRRFKLGQSAGDAAIDPYEDLYDGLYDE